MHKCSITFDRPRRSPRWMIELVRFTRVQLRAIGNIPRFLADAYHYKVRQRFTLRKSLELAGNVLRG